MVSLRDVAREAGVSIATVSKLINRAKDWERFSDNTRELVERTAKRLGYQGSYLARALQSGRSQAVGIVAASSDYHGDFMARVVAAMDQAVREAGLHSVIIGGEHRHEVGRFLLEGRVDGLLLPAGADSSQLDTDTPAVQLLHRHNQQLPAVLLNEAAGIQAAVEHLAAHGRRQLLWLGLSDNPADQSRWCQIKKNAQLYDIRCRRIAYSSSHRRDHDSHVAEISSARQCLNDFLHTGKRCDAICCYNDLTGIGALAALQQHGIAVPHDCAVIGFDDLHATLAVPALSSISHMLLETGRAAVARLSDNTLPAVQTLDPILVVRASSCPSS